MKLLLMIIFWILINPLIYSYEIADSVTINRDNYFDFHVKPTSEYSVSINWLTKDEITAIINEELKSKSYKMITNVLYKLENDTFVVLEAYDDYADVGYFLQRGHGSAKNDRENPKIYLEYVQNNIFGQYALSPLPPNIVIFKEDWYWFQEVHPINSNTKVFTITKDQIIEILRQDVNYYFK